LAVELSFRTASSVSVFRQGKRMDSESDIGKPELNRTFVVQVLEAFSLKEETEHGARLRNTLGLYATGAPAGATTASVSASTLMRLPTGAL
jgi:hypothetical protein